jgi:hypothetical protein
VTEIDLTPPNSWTRSRLRFHQFFDRAIRKYREEHPWPRARDRAIPYSRFDTCSSRLCRTIPILCWRPSPLESREMELEQLCAQNGRLGAVSRISIAGRSLTSGFYQDKPNPRVDSIVTATKIRSPKQQAVVAVRSGTMPGGSK